MLVPLGAASILEVPRPAAEVALRRRAERVAGGTQGESARASSCGAWEGSVRGSLCYYPLGSGRREGAAKGGWREGGASGVASLVPAPERKMSPAWPGSAFPRPNLSLPPL